MTTPPAPPSGASSRLCTAAELLGFALLVAFGATWGARWGILAAAVILIVAANLRAANAHPARPSASERLARALAAYRGSGP